MRKVTSIIKSYLPGLVAVLLSVLLVYLAKDYPCLKGAGLALADLEAFLLAVFLSMPCFVWGVLNVIRLKDHFVRFDLLNGLLCYLATVVVLVNIYVLSLLLPVIMSIDPHPLHFLFASC